MSTGFTVAQLVAIKGQNGTGECPECWAETPVVDRIRDEVVQCPECGTDLVVLEFLDAPRPGESISEVTVVLGLPDKEREDWGE